MTTRKKWRTVGRDERTAPRQLLPYMTRPSPAQRGTLCSVPPFPMRTWRWVFTRFAAQAAARGEAKSHHKTMSTFLLCSWLAYGREAPCACY